jgi:hypothetical protein
MGLASAAGAEPDGNLACIEKLQIPDYPTMPRQARISGVVIATIKLTPDGRIRSLSTRFDAGSNLKAGPLFLPTVETALRSSVYAKACEDKPITLVFNFVIGENFLPDNVRERVSFGYPNRFWILVPPEVVNP